MNHINRIRPKKENIERIKIICKAFSIFRVASQNVRIPSTQRASLKCFLSLNLIRQFLCQSIEHIMILRLRRSILGIEGCRHRIEKIRRKEGFSPEKIREKSDANNTSQSCNEPSD